MQKRRSHNDVKLSVQGMTHPESRMKACLWQEGIGAKNRAQDSLHAEGSHVSNNNTKD